MPHEGRAPSLSAPPISDEALWGHVYRLDALLRDAVDEDGVGRVVLGHLVDLPGVSRVGLALVEGAGRRLRFLASDRGAGAGAWCHIDAYDDVPLTSVLRTGAPVWGSLDQLERPYPGLVAKQRKLGNRALAALPLRGGGPVLGGIVVFFASPQSFDANQVQLLETCARRTAEALRRVYDARVGARRGTPVSTPASSTVSTSVSTPVGVAGDAQAARVELDADPSAASAARRFVRTSLNEWGVDEDTNDNAQLCVSELVTNAIMHARASSELSVLLEGDVLEVVVRDHGGSASPDLPAAPPGGNDEDPMVVAGRGLSVVDAVADRWGTERDESGTVAWFVLEVTAASSRVG